MLFRAWPWVSIDWHLKLWNIKLNCKWISICQIFSEKNCHTFYCQSFYYMVCVIAHWHLPVWNRALLTTSTQLGHSIKCCNPLFTHFTPPSPLYHFTPPSPLYGQLMLLYMGKHPQGNTFMFWVENSYLQYNFCCSISVDLYCWSTRPWFTAKLSQLSENLWKFPPGTFSHIWYFQNFWKNVWNNKQSN